MPAIPVADWIAYHARLTPEHPACVDLASGRRFDYGAFNRRIDRLANALRHDPGVCPGDRVAVLAKNDSDVFAIQFACQRLAAIFVPLNWRLAPDELRFILDDAQPRVLLHHAAFADTAALACSGLPRYALDDMLIERASDTPAAVDLPRDSDVWTMIYTSGTTGRPKGAQITYRMALFNAITLAQAFAIDAVSRNLVLLPTFHTGGLNVFANPTFFAGGVNLIAREFDPAVAVALLAAGEVTHLMGVPTIHAALAEQPGFAGLARTVLRGVAVAGAPCPVELIERYAEIGLDLRQCWGMTEAGPLALLMPANAPATRRGSSGLPSMFVQSAIADRDGKPVAVGEVGELLVRGPVVTPGYWRRARHDGFTADGWLRTGDAARRDEDGFHTIVDRWKDMFISGGENVYPAEIERVLADVAGVAECAVIGVPDARWGEAGCAFVVPAPGVALQHEALAAHCVRRLAKFKVPRNFVLVDALPRNATGKVLKTVLRQHALPERNP
jgi:fatty-acyl-CoA synthase